MVDKMMRIAGKGLDGTAKALKVDNTGLVIMRSNSTEQFTDFNAVAVSGWGPTRTLEGNMQTAVLEVTGVFTGVRFYFQAGLSADSRAECRIYSVSQAAWLPGTNIREPGIYYVNVSGMTTTRSRLDAISSGSFTLKTQYYATPLPQFVKTDPIITDVILQDAATFKTNGSVISVTDFKSVTFEVTGTFDATIRPQIRFTDSGATFFWVDVFNVLTGLWQSGITAPGIYKADVDGMNQFRCRVDGYTSGAVTVIARGSLAALDKPASSVPRGRIELIRKGETPPISGDSGLHTINLPDITGYPFTFMTVTSAAHLMEVTFQFTAGEAGITSSDDSVMIIQGSYYRVTSPWLETTGSGARAYIKNLSDSEKTYKYAIYGVR